MTVQVNKDICTGCGRCVEACPAGAIRIDESSRKAIIDASLCTDCGACLNSCRKGAISFSTGPSGSRTRTPRGGAYASGRGGTGAPGSAGPGRGRGGGQGSGRGAGCGGRQKPGIMGECCCPGCGISIPHRPGVPCSQVKCPSCGNSMIRK